MLPLVVFLNYSCLAHTSIIHKDDSTDLLELKLNKSLEKVRNECKADNDLLKKVIQDQSRQVAYLFNTIAAMVNNTVEHNNGNRTLPDNYQLAAELNRREIRCNLSGFFFTSIYTSFIKVMRVWSSIFFEKYADIDCTGY